MFSCIGFMSSFQMKYMSNRGFYFVPENNRVQYQDIAMIVKKNMFYFLQTNTIKNGNGNDKLQIVGM